MEEVMSFAEASALLDEVTNFFGAQGGAYQRVTGTVQENVLFCLAARQYVYSPGRYFACYFRVWPQDVDSLKERVRPVDVVSGPVMYVAEAACLPGAMKDMIVALRKGAKGWGAGVFWHRPARKDRVAFFPSQRGEEG